MLKIFAICPTILFFSCTPFGKQNDSSQISGNVFSSQVPCQTSTPPSVVTKPVQNRPVPPPVHELAELKEKIYLHGDINKNSEHMEFVLNALTNRYVSFKDQSSTNPLATLDLVPHFQQCCEQELARSQYRDYGSCLERIFGRVLSKDQGLEYHLLSLGKGLLLELSPKGRKGWCRYIDYVWNKYRAP